MSDILPKKQGTSRRPDKKPALAFKRRTAQRGQDKRPWGEYTPTAGRRSRGGFPYFSLALMAACAAATLAIGTRNGEQLTYESPAL